MTAFYTAGVLFYLFTLTVPELPSGPCGRTATSFNKPGECFSNAKAVHAGDR